MFSLIASVVYILDLVIVLKVTSSISIADGFSSGPSLPAMGTAVIILGVFYLLFLFAIIVSSFKTFIPERDLNFLALTLVSLLFDIPRQGIFYKFSSCFNYPSHSLIYARASLTFILYFLILVSNLIILVRRSKDFKCLGALNLILFFFISVSIFYLNSKILAELKPVLKNPIGPYNIQMAFLNSSELAQVQNNSYQADDIFELKSIGRLSDIIFSKDKILAYSDCDSSCQPTDTNCHCTDYYWHYLDVQIKCDSKFKIFYKDCENSTSLKIVMEYLDGGKYPAYNCAKLDDKVCKVGCPDLIANYKLYLVQKSQDASKIEKAWNGLCNCNKNPSITLGYHSDLDICHSNAIKFKTNIFFIFGWLFLIQIFICKN